MVNKFWTQRWFSSYPKHFQPGLFVLTYAKPSYTSTHRHGRGLCTHHLFPTTSDLTPNYSYFPGVWNLSWPVSILWSPQEFHSFLPADSLSRTAVIAQCENTLVYWFLLLKKFEPSVPCFFRAQLCSSWRKMHEHLHPLQYNLFSKRLLLHGYSLLCCAWHAVRWHFNFPSHLTIFNQQFVSSNFED